MRARMSAAVEACFGIIFKRNPLETNSVYPVSKIKFTSISLQTDGKRKLSLYYPITGLIAF